MNDRQRLEAIVSVINKYLPPFGMHIMDAMSAIISLVDPLPPPQPAQEPVARVTGVYGGRFTYEPINPAMVLPVGMALYAGPPKRQWIWLSDADIRETIDSICQYNGDYDEWLCKKIERKIKELNT